jgi:phosphate/sulfate permease
MSDSARRATRTLVQTSLAAGVIALLTAFEVIHWSSTQTVAVMAVATPCIGFLQAILEDHAVVPALLRTPVPAIEGVV